MFCAKNLTTAESLSVEELVQLPIIGYTQLENPATRWLARYARHASMPVRCNNVLAAYQCAVNGMGLAVLPENHGWDLQSLYYLPQEYDSGLWLLTHPEMRNAARIRAFWDFLIEALSPLYKTPSKEMSKATAERATTGR